MDNKSEKPSNQIQIRLIPEFRFRHQNDYDLNDLYKPTIHTEQIEAFANRLLLSDGGAFLITGYRGVGKSTFVNQSLCALKNKLEKYPLYKDQKPQLLNVQLNITRALKGVELMYSILSQLNKRLVDTGLLPLLPETVRDDLQLSLLRTSSQLSTKNATSQEVSASFKKLFSIGSKSKFDNSKELSYLAYDERSAEADLISLSNRLVKGFKPKRLMGLTNAFTRPVKIKLIFVFDELDKIEEEDKKINPLLDIFSSLKTLFSTSGINFVFVAGYRLQEQWHTDIQRGDGIYESVFSDYQYIPAVWHQVDKLCDPLIHAPLNMSQYKKDFYDSFKSYLSFIGRGIPRRIVRQFYERVKWDGSSAFLQFHPSEKRRIQFFSKLNSFLLYSEEKILGEYAHELRPELKDKQRLGLYYIVDWILTKGFTPFTLTELNNVASEKLNKDIAPEKTIATRTIMNLLNQLLSSGYIIEEAVTVDEEHPEGIQFRVQYRYLIEMGIRHQNNAPNTTTFVQENSPPAQLLNRYQILSLEGEGSTGKVYKALDETTDNIVAIKYFKRDYYSQQSALSERFWAEFDVHKSLVNEGIVQCLDGHIDKQHAFLVTEYIDGTNLSNLLPIKDKLPQDCILTIISQLLTTLSYIHKMGVIWRDVSPSNILISRESKVLISDFGSAQTKANTNSGPDTTRPGFAVGTKKYMSPEQMQGAVLSPASDMFSIAIVFYELLVEQITSNFQENINKLSYFWQEKLFDSRIWESSLSDSFKRLFSKALAPDPKDRFQNANEFLAALPTFEKTSIPSELFLNLKMDSEDKTFSGQFSSGTRFSNLDDITNITDIQWVGKTDQFSSSDSKQIEIIQPEYQDEVILDIHGIPTKVIEKKNKIDHIFVSRKLTEVSSEEVRSRYHKLNTLQFAAIDGENMRYFKIRKYPIIIGRNKEADLCLAHNAELSRYHAQIIRKDGNYFIEDLNSVNGVIVNKKQIPSKPVQLVDGDNITFSDTIITFKTPASTS